MTLQQVQIQYGVSVTRTLSNQALHQQQSLILPHQTIWNGNIAVRVIYRVCVPLQSAGPESCCDVASLILLLVYPSLFCAYRKTPDVRNTVWPSSCECRTSIWSCQIKDATWGADPSPPPPCCTGAFVLEVPSRDPDLSPSKFFWPSSRQTLHSNCSISSVSQGLTLATFPICC